MADTVASLRDALNLVSQSGGFGSRSSSFADLLSGFNHRSMGLTVPINTEGQGMTFFTRPNMNLSSNNCAADRILTQLNTDRADTYQRVIRLMLDPYRNLFAPTQQLTSPLFDAKQAFMPLLSNALISLNGWPDIALDTYTSKEGRLRENYSMVDGTSKNLGTFDLQAAFRNLAGDPITLLMLTWATYMDCVREGNMVPYLTSIIQNRIDYHSRIFRFTLDPSRTRIQKWGSTTGVFPIGVPIGAALNFSNDTPYSHDNAEQISLGFRCHTATYMDPILFYEFNDTVVMFNPEMADDAREVSYVKVAYEYLHLFNYQGYPRANPDTAELEWWVDPNVSKGRINGWNALATSARTAPAAPAKTVA